uniref:SHSP domain-containing protein n=1 Tax=Ditylenchus dipsaci TaxID=166011 RepID=A0A915DAK6_9BILA
MPKLPLVHCSIFCRLWFHSASLENNFRPIFSFCLNGFNDSSRSRIFDDNWWPERDSSVWRDRFSKDWYDWPTEWPRPRDVLDRFRGNSDKWWSDWPSDWPRMDAIVPRFSSHLDRFDKNWRIDPFWRDLYPKWAEPIFKEGLDVKTNIVNDRGRFAVDIDAYQFRPEELQVKTFDDTLLIEGRHEDVRDPDNYTKMYFVRKYQLPTDVFPQDISSSIDSRGHLTVEAQKRHPAIEYRERTIPIASAHNDNGMKRAIGSRSNSYSPRDRHDSGRGSDGSFHQNFRTESRNNNIDPNYLSPQTNGYRNEFSTRSADANGLHHSRRSEEFREEIRRSGSQQSIIPPAPLLRTESRQSVRDAQQFNRSASSSRNDNYNNFRVDTPGENVNILRPTEELGDRAQSRASQSRSERSVRISKTFA